MPIGSGARTQLRYILESVFGTTPGTGNPNNLRRTDDSLSYKISTTMSEEIRSDRQNTDLVVVGASAEGGVNFELSYKEFDAFMEAALQGTWSVYGTNGVGTTFTSTATTTTITAAVAPTGSSAFTNLQRGQWIRVAGAGLNVGRVVQVSRTVSPTATVITLEAATPLLAESNVAGVLIQASRLTNGVVQRSFSLERHHSDVPQFIAFRGMVVSKMSLQLESQKIVTGSFDFMGRDQVLSASTTLPGTPVASQTFDVMNAVSGVGNLMENGAAISGTFIKSLSLTVDNSLRGRDGIGVLGNADIGSGSLVVTGQMSVYFADVTIYNRFLNNTRTNLNFRVSDGAGNGYVFQLPGLEYSDATIKAGTKNSDSMIDFSFTAVMDPTTGQTIFIDRVGA